MIGKLLRWSGILTVAFLIFGYMMGQSEQPKEQKIEQK